MLQRTTGIVIHTTPYGETSLIAKVFTRKLGLRSYIVKGVRSSKGRTKQNLMQPMSYLDMVVYDKPRDINFIKEMQPAHHWQTLDTQPQKTALRFFASEALYKSLREAEPSPTLFDYVVEQMQQLDDTACNIAAYPIMFLLGLARHLGIEPMDNYSKREGCFNLNEGCFQSQSTIYPQMTQETSLLLHHYLQSFHSGTTPTGIPLADRQTLLANLISYYEVHLAGFGNFKSHEVLHAVLI